MSSPVRLKLWPLILALAVVPSWAQKFFPDDPLEKEPPPFRVDGANLRQLSPVLEVFGSVLKNTKRAAEARGTVSAQGVNTLGEVLDGPWYVNRHATRRLTEAELLRGPGDQDAPSRAQPWKVLAANRFGQRQGLLIADSRNTIYLLRFDPLNHLEMSTGAAMVGSRIFHALGYWVPEHYLVYVQRPELVASPTGQQINAEGKAQKLDEEDIDLLLRKAAKDPKRGYRAIALKVPTGAKLIGPYQFFGRRSDDPNDIVPHEHRRDLRGLYVICAWVGNNWISSYQTADALVTEAGTRHIRHYFIDFLNFLGAGARQDKQAREGNDPFVDVHNAAKNLAGMGIYSPAWQRAKFPGMASVGGFESQVFDPAKWRPNLPSAALANRTPADDYWAAKEMLAFTDEDIRAIVKSGEYSDPAAAEWIAKCLIERRDKVARHFLEGVLPLDRFRIENGELKFDDLAAVRGLRPARSYSVEWAEFRNHTKEHTPIPGARSFQIPDQLRKTKPGLYFSAKVTADNGDPQRLVYVYMRMEADSSRVVGVDRMWPGQRTAEQMAAEKQIPNRYVELQPRQRELFDTFAAAYNKKTGFHVEPQAFFDAQSISERTTFEAITNALSKTELTDQTGKSMGTALDLVTGIERIAGQYYGRSGDEQFRLYCLLRPDARAVIEKSREFRFGEENAVFHAGYAHSYRQLGKEPTLQFSISDDGLKADIDVDYRSSKPPQAVWNGHLSSANSDVRARDNYKRHNERWSGLVNWWQGRFGNLGTEEAEPPDLLSSPKKTATTLPADRPANAAIAEVQDAVQEFLTDWLVRRKYDEALLFVSDQALSCAGADAERDLPQDRAHLRQLMKQASERIGRFENLTDAIEAVVPWRKAFRVQRHTFEGEFALVQAPDAYAEAFQCQNRSDAALTKAMDDPNPAYGNYYGAVFRVKTGDNSGGVLGLLWTREQNAWRLVAWKVFGQ